MIHSNPISFALMGKGPPALGPKGNYKNYLQLVSWKEYGKYFYGLFMNGASFLATLDSSPLFWNTQ